MAAKTFDRERLKKLFARKQDRHEKAHHEHEAAILKMQKQHAKARQEMHERHHKARADHFENALKALKDGPKGAPIYKSRIKQ